MDKLILLRQIFRKLKIRINFNFVNLETCKLQFGLKPNWSLQVSRFTKLKLILIFSLRKICLNKISLSIFFELQVSDLDLFQSALPAMEHQSDLTFAQLVGILIFSFF